MALRVFAGLADVTPASGDKIVVEDATTGNLQYATVGDAATADPDAMTAQALTDNSGGTAADTIAAIGGTYSQSEVANAVASLADEVNKLRTDVVSIRTQLVALLAETAFVR